MTTTREMVGLAEFLPGQGVGRLRVQQLISRRPEPKYEAKCDVCGTVQVVTHSQLRHESARCRFSGCGKTSKPKGRDLLSEEHQRLATRDAQRLAEEREASERRMAAEADGWERPTKYAPTPDPHVVLTQRQRLELQAKREQEEAEERERLRPIREAAEQAEREAAQREQAQRGREAAQRAYWSEWIQSDRDPQLYVTPELLTASMPTKEASAHNEREVAKFMEMTPDFAEFRTPANADKIIAYFERNGVRIFDAAMVKAAFFRLRDLGILVKRPAPQPQRVEQPQRVNLSVAPAKAPSGPKTYVGRDHATGVERTFTQREVDRMSSLEYQRAFQIVPTVSELFTRMSGER
jgi:hypothetical protein